MDVNNNNYRKKPSFAARISENEIKLGLEAIINNGSNVVKKNIDYFTDMKKGSNISQERKANINEWLREKLNQALSFDVELEEAKTIEHIKFSERKESSSNNGFIRLIKKGIDNLTNPKSMKKHTQKHPLIQMFESRKEEASFFKRFQDLFTSYLELTPKVTEDTEYKSIELEDLLRQIGLEKYGLDMNTKMKTQSIAEPISTRPSPNIKQQTEKKTSHIPQKEFSQNPLEQIDEKYHYIHYEVLPLIEKSPDDYYEGLSLFEKYGTRTSFQGMDYHTLQHIGMTFPDNPSPKIVDKFMDIFEKFGKGLHLDHDGIINFGDGNNYMTHIAQKGVISSIEQLRNALEKGKKIIWSNDGIDELKNTLTRGENAPFYGNQEVEDILQQFYITAFNNRTPFKDNPDIKALEEKFWHVHRD